MPLPSTFYDHLNLNNLPPPSLWHIYYHLTYASPCKLYQNRPLQSATALKTRIDTFLLNSAALPLRYPHSV